MNDSVLLFPHWLSLALRQRTFAWSRAFLNFPLPAVSLGAFWTSVAQRGSFIHHSWIAAVAAPALESVCVNSSLLCVQTECKGNFSQWKHASWCKLAKMHLWRFENVSTWVKNLHISRGFMNLRGGRRQTGGNNRKNWSFCWTQTLTVGNWLFGMNKHKRSSSQSMWLC